MYIRAMSHRVPTYRLGPNFDSKLTDFVAKFISEGFDCFKTEFGGLDDFIRMARADKSKRDDHRIRRSAKELYLLEAVSFKIYNELNREAFNRAKNTLIIIPNCLTLHNADCLKSDDEWGDQCQRCVDHCQADQICEVADRYGIEVVFSKKKLSEQLEHFEKETGDMAVIGVACLMMLSAGMRRAAEMDIPARGVLLNFTGCDHWNDEEFASEMYLDRLEVILREKYE